MDKKFSISEILAASNNILNESSNNLTATKNHDHEPLLLTNEISEVLNIDEKIKNGIIKELYFFFKKKVKKNTIKIIFDQQLEIKKFQRKIYFLNEDKKVLENNKYDLQSNLDQIIVEKKILETNNHNLQSNLDQIIEEKKILETNNHNLQSNLDQIIEEKKILETNNHNFQSSFDQIIEEKKALTEENIKIQKELSLQQSNLKSNLPNEKLIVINNKLKFYQEDNLRLSNELFKSKERYDTVKSQLNNFELQKNEISNQIQQLNNSINKSNLITHPFAHELPKETKEDLKKLNSEDMINLDASINKIFSKL